ncbi:MAG: hypothetical protein AAF916_11190 [Planctomycetota bacterium]
MAVSGDTIKLAVGVAGLVAGATLFGCVGGTLALAAAGTVGGLFGELAGGKAEKLLDRLFRKREDILGNHDLHKLSAKAINEVLRDVETNDPALVRMIAKVTPWWDSLGNNEPRDLPAFRDHDLIDLFVRPADAALPTALTVDEWQVLVDDLARFAEAGPNEATCLTAAKALHERLADVARNLAKEDASQNGRIAAGITLTLLGEAVDHLRGVLPTIDAAKQETIRAAEGKALELAKLIAASHADLQDRVIEVSARCNSLAAAIGRMQWVVADTNTTVHRNEELLQKILANQNTLGQESEQAYKSRIAELEAALEQAHAAAATGNADAEAALADIRASGDTKRLQAFLVEKRNGDMSKVVERSREIASVAFTRGDMVEAQRSVNLILANSPEDLAATLANAQIAHMQGRLDIAKREFQRLRDNSDRHHYTALAHMGSGHVFALERNFVFADICYLAAIDAGEACGDERLKAMGFSGLGNLYFETKRYLLAWQYYTESLAVCRRNREWGSVACDLANLGLVLMERKQFVIARKMFRIALRLEVRIGRLEGQACVLGYLGSLAFLLNDLASAYDFQIEAMRLNEKIGRLIGIADAKASLAQIERHRGNRELAVEHWRDACELYSEAGMSHMVDQLQAWTIAADG